MTLRLVLITPEHVRQRSDLAPLERVAAEKLQDVGVLVRAPKLALADYSRLARDVAEICRPAEMKVIVHGVRAAQLARDLDAGLHFPEREWSEIPVPACIWRSISVHAASDVGRVERFSPTVVFVGSVFASPGKAAMGLETFAKLRARISSPVRVFALGGIDATTARACMEAGANGVAVIRSVWEAPNPSAAVETLLRATRARRDPVEWKVS